ncbi:unnamed protein product [Eretmochelys imbricata]
MRGLHEMKLFLALALLGAVSSRRLSEGTLEQEELVEQDRSVLEEELGELEPPPGGGQEFHGERCSGPEASLRSGETGQDLSWGHGTKCTQMFRGHLASIHSNSANKQPHSAASLITHWGQVWVGGITSSSGGRTLSHWMDRTPQNYSNWASGNPSSSGETCVALCTADGHWRSTDCQTLLPFICEH